MWGDIATGFESRQQEVFTNAALAEVKEEFGSYFDAIQQPPRMLVGQEVPSPSGEGMERLRDSADARDWQDAIKHLLKDTVVARAEQRATEAQDTFATIHSSIDLFRANPDLVPGTKQFDRQLADEFVALAKAYELRVDGKLTGYSVPVQPLIAQLRTQIQARRAATPAAPSPAAQRAAEQPRTPTGQWDAPQAGIGSKAGRSGAAGDDIAGGVMDAFFRQNGMTI